MLEDGNERDMQPYHDTRTLAPDLTAAYTRPINCPTKISVYWVLGALVRCACAAKSVLQGCKCDLKRDEKGRWKVYAFEITMHCQ